MDPTLRTEELLAEMGWLHALALKMLGDAHLAEDTAQAVLAQALDQPPARREGEGLRGWLARLVKNEASSQRRTAKRRRDRERRTAEGKPTSSPAASDIVACGSLHQRVSQAVLELPEPYASTVLYRYLKGLSVGQVAERMEASPATVRKRLSRAVALLRDRLESELDSPVQAWAPLLLADAAKPAGLASLAAPPSIATLALVPTWSKIAATAAALAVLMGAGYLWQRARKDPEPQIAALAAEVLAEPPAEEQLAAEDSPESLTGAPAASARAIAPAEVQSDILRLAGLPEARISGKLVDQNGRPIPGEALLLYAETGADWRSGYQAPLIPDNPDRRRGWRFVTGPDGDFSVTCPVPTTGDIDLEVMPSVYWSLTSRTFGPGRTDNEPQLIEGDNNLGDTILYASGALSGRVTDSSANPLAGVVVSATSNPSTGRISSAITDANGDYLLGHLPPGPSSVTVALEGHITRFVTSSHLEVGETIPQPDIEMSRAPIIEGIVVDQAGKPVPGIDLWGWPLEEGLGAGATSAADGTFQIALKQSGALEVGFEGNSSYQPWGGLDEPDARMEPGSTVHRVVLRAAPQYRVRVLDASTRDPIERFGAKALEIQRGSSRTFSHPRHPQIFDYPGGLATVPAEPGGHRLLFRAEGYAPQRVDTVALPPGTQAHEILLIRGGALKAQVELDGRPAIALQVKLCRDAVPEERAVADDRILGREGIPYYDLDPYSGREQSFAGDADGRFEIPRLAPGTYRLELNANDAAPFTREGIVIGPDTVDLGVLQLQAEGSIEGRVTMAEGVSPIGLWIGLDSDPKAVRIDRADGTFTLRSLPPGDHELVLQSAPPVLLQPISRTVAIAPGTTKTIAIDAAAYAPARVQVLVTQGGQAVAGVRVNAGGSAPPAMLMHRFQNPSPPRETDASGRVTILVHPDPAVRLSVALGSVVLGRTQPIAVPPGAELQHAIEVQTGRLRIAFPDAYQLPERGGFVVRLRHADEPDTLQMIHGSRPHAEDSFSPAIPWTTRLCDLGALATGRYSIEVLVRDRSPEAVQSAEFQTPAKGTIEIREGETCTFEVERP